MGRGPLAELLKLRARYLAAVRRFMTGRGFLEVDTPALVPYPEATPQIEPFRTCLETPDRPPIPLWLHSSPEHFMKRMLAAGSGPIFQICRFYRNGEIGRLHNPEFLGLEWYEPGSDYFRLMDLTEELVRELAAELAAGGRIEVDGRPVDLAGPWERLTVAEAMERGAGVAPAALLDRDQLAAEAAARGLAAAPGEPYDDVFFRLFLNRVEPRLGSPRPTFLYDYPLALGALARRSPRDPRWAERVELYIGPVEIANGYTELTDPAEQADRFARELARKYPDRPAEPDRGLLAALAAGLPESSGNALGLDRLLMLLAGAGALADVLPFPMAEVLAAQHPPGRSLDDRRGLW